MFPGYRCAPRKSSAIKRRKGGRRSASPPRQEEPAEVADAPALTERQRFFLNQNIRMYRVRTEHLRADAHAEFENEVAADAGELAQAHVDEEIHAEDDEEVEEEGDRDQEARFAEDFEVANRCRL